MEGRGWKAEWADVVEDLERVKEIRIETDGRQCICAVNSKERRQGVSVRWCSRTPSVRILKKMIAVTPDGAILFRRPTTIYVVPRLLFRFVTSCLSRVIFYLL